MKPDIKVVLRMFDADLAEKIERGFGIHTAFSASGLAAPAFAAAATRAHIEYSFYVGDTLLHVSQVTVDDDSPLAGLTMEDAERKFDMTIIMHNTGEHMHLHPQYDELIHTNDTLVVFATLETLGKIGGMNHNHGQTAPGQSKSAQAHVQSAPDRTAWLTKISRPLHIVIVGPCASGKTTLVRGLWARGYSGARVVAQEHSGVIDLWKMRGQPDVLIYLDAQLDTIAARQRRTDWTHDYLAEQLRRLSSAWTACDLYLPTDDLTPAGSPGAHRQVSDRNAAE